MALIDVSRATELIPNFPSGDLTLMGDLVNAASDLVVRYCNRDFVLTTYDEVYDGSGAINLLLNQYPVTQILRIARCPLNVLGIHNANNNVSRASWRLDADSSVPVKPNNLYLVSVLNGIETDITFSGICTSSPTVTINGGTPTTIAQLNMISDLATAINTYAGSYGWVGQGIGQYGTWALSDIRPPQGAMEARWFGFAYVMLHSLNLFSFDYNPDIGEIVSPQGFEFGYRTFRVIYQAGYATVPNPIQQAVAALALSVYQSRGQNSNLTNENLGGYSYTQATEKTFHQMDLVSRYGLNLWKNHRIRNYKVNL